AARDGARRPVRIEHEMDAREQMHEQVARYAGAVVAIIAPAEQTHGLEWPLRRAAEEPVPIDRLRRRVGWNRILPGAERRVAVDPGLDEIQFAKRAGANQIPRLGVHDRAGVLAADLQDPAALARGVDEADAVLQPPHHRLFD